MAVSGGSVPNLSNDYQNILTQLDRQGQIAQTQGQQKFGVANAIAAPIERATGQLEDFTKDKAETAYKASLEDQLNQHKEQYRSEGEGRIKVTDEVYDKFLKDNNITPEEAKQAHLGIYKGAYVKPEDVLGHLRTAQRESDFAAKVETAAQVLESKGDSENANAVRALAALPGEKLATASELGKALTPTQQREKASSSSKIITDPDTGEKFSVQEGKAPKQITGPSEAVLPGQKAVRTTQLVKNDKVALQKAKESFVKQTKDEAARLKTIDELKSSVLSGNPVSKFNEQIELVKLGGISAGRISQGEIVRDQGSQALAQKGIQLLSTKATGKWTEENKKLITQYADLLKNEQEQYLTRLHQATSESMASNLPRVDPEFIKTELATPIPAVRDAIENQEARSLLLDRKKKVTPESLEVAKKYIKSHKNGNQ